MKILFLAVGKKHDPSISEAVVDFTGRISRYAPVEWKLIAPSQDAREEGAAILTALDDRDYAVLLDEAGKEYTSRELADFIDKRLTASVHRLVFIIGGAYGVSEDVRARCSGSHGTCMSLSRLTFPHQLVRLILSEQVYRTFTILRGEKYHHE